MAVTKIHAIKRTVNKAISYITNPDKTDGTILTSGYNCEPTSAYLDFQMTSLLASEINGGSRHRRGTENAAYHLIQSFAKFDKITPEKAHELGQQLAEEMFQGKHEYVVTTHIDKGHIHNHIIVNAVSFYDFGKLRTEPYKTARKIREISDRLCAENGLHVILNPKGQGKAQGEWYAHKEGRSWKSQIRTAINKAIREAVDYDEFTALLAAAGIEIKEGKHIAFRFPGQERFTRGKTIGEDFTRERIIQRIERTKGVAKAKNMAVQGNVNRTGSRPFPLDKRIVYISRKKRIAQTQALAAMLVMVRREGILGLRDFNEKINKLKDQCRTIRQEIKQIDEKNMQYKNVAKWLVAYNKYLPIHQEYEQLAPAAKKRFQTKNEGALLAFAHAEKQLNKTGISTGVDSDKVIEMVKQQTQRSQDLQTQFQQTEVRVNELARAQEKMTRIIKGESPEEQEQKRHKEQERAR